ncbi:MAG: T9SS type A sorting domain-containing protein [Melioribacteraceae bacterium]|nr:T9SS type A sorting domain-containing protein [Melioribacteraceae bacterium]
MKNLIFVLVICIVNILSAQDPVIMEGEMEISIIGLSSTMDISFSATKIVNNPVWYPTRYWIGGNSAEGLLVDDHEFDEIIVTKRVSHTYPYNYVYFDCEYDDSEISVGLAKYEIKKVGGSSKFIWNTQHCGSWLDNEITYDFSSDKFYYGQTVPFNSNNEIKNYDEIGAWTHPQNVSCLELYTLLTNLNGHPYLVWNPYHNPSLVSSYKIFKKKNSPNYELLASTTGLDYLDTTEYIYDGGGNKTYASYYVKAELTSGGLSPASNKVSAAVDDVGQLEKMTVTNNNENEISLSNYPNPFNPETTISFSIANSSLVSITVYDLLGRKIAELINEIKEAGSYEVNFNAENHPSGLFIYKLTTNVNIVTKKMMLLR